MSESQLKYLLDTVSVNSDRESFKKLYFYYYKKLFCLARLLVKSDEGAEEIVNDAFVTIWEKRSQLTAVNNFTAYSYIIVRNRSLNYRSKDQLTIHLDIGELDKDITDLSPNAEDQLLLSELKNMINESISKLPDQCRLVFKLVKQDGFKYKEVSGLLNISLKTVEYHMGIALKRLAESLNYSQKTSGDSSFKKKIPN